MSPIEKFVAHLQLVINSFYQEFYPDTNFPIACFEDSKRYWRVYRQCEKTKTIYCFVRKEDQAILKASNWRTPSLQAGIKGYLNNYPDALLGGRGLAGVNGFCERPTIYPKYER